MERIDSNDDNKIQNEKSVAWFYANLFIFFFFFFFSFVGDSVVCTASRFVSALDNHNTLVNVIIIVVMKKAKIFILLHKLCY